MCCIRLILLAVVSLYYIHHREHIVKIKYQINQFLWFFVIVLSVQILLNVVEQIVNLIYP